MPDRASSRILLGRSRVEPAFTPDDGESDRQASAEAAVEEGYRRGMNEGIAEGRNEAAREFGEQLAAVRLRLAESLAILAAAAESVCTEQEARMVELAVVAGARIARDRIAADDPVVVRATREAVEALPGGGPLKVRLNPEDLTIVREHLADPPVSERLELVEDATVERGGCVVEGEFGTVDATLGTAEAAVREEALG